MHPLLKTVSKDPSYGYTKENPVKVGRYMRGVPSAQIYLMSLRDKEGRPFSFSRNGNVGQGADGHVIDHYILTSCKGEDVSIYMDIYHEECDADFQDAPVGMTKSSPNFYSIEMAQLAKNPPKKKRWWQLWK